jgi:hypothetical protein
MPRQFRVLIYTACATAVASMGWGVLLFGGLLYLVFGEQNFPRAIFWVVMALSVPAFLVVFFKYFNRVER